MPYTAGNVIFPLLRIFAGGLAQSFRGLLDVEDVIHDLKRKPDVLAVHRKARRTAPDTRRHG